MKKGIFLPLVLFFLLVLAMLGIMFNRNSQTEFRQAYYTSDMLRAHMIAEAALEEALAETRAKLNNEFRNKFINGGKLSISLKHSKDLKSDVITLDDGATTNPISYSVSVKAECINVKSINDCDDKLGTLVYEINCSVNKVRRDLKTSYDYKVVDVRPVGNEFCFMVDDSATEAFNNPPNFFVDARTSFGISIGKSAINIDLHQPYDKISQWGPSNNLDLHSEGDHEKSLIPGGTERKKESHDMDMNTIPGTNKPYEKKEKGTMGDAIAVHGGKTEFEHDSYPESCGKNNGSTTVNYEDPGIFSFNSGLYKGKSRTHFLGKNCETAEGVNFYGDIKKIFTIWGYNYEDIQHANKMMCAKFWSECATCISTCGSVSSDPQPCAAHKNAADWTRDDKWNVRIIKERAELPYETSEAKIKNKKSVPWNERINYKGNFSAIKKTATRFVETFPGPLRDTFIANNNIYLEGNVVCNNAEIKSLNTFRTPGGIVARDSINISGNLKNGTKVSYSDSYFSGDFFKSENVLSVISYNTIINSGGIKKGVGFMAENLFKSTDMTIQGNLTLKRLDRKNFGNNSNYSLKYDNTFISKKYLIDSGKSYVISVSPIPSSYIVLNN
ncbi:MAG: hypothetical protein M0R46_13065 [Candidatus Muirbacterium halophilum]|nr:hypothetical protein [Candidatus Muirbacterium halophilum]MCK9476850.1 hypothetical protein [Candidatus Muirbacterium halophilum]